MGSVRWHQSEWLMCTSGVSVWALGRSLGKKSVNCGSASVLQVSYQVAHILCSVEGEDGGDD